MIPTEPVQFLQWFDVVTLSALLVILSSTILAHRRKTGSVLATISQTMAATPRSQLVFSVSMSCLYPLYYVFIWFWVGPITHMSTSFYYLLAVAAIFEMIFVWVPATTGKRQIIHTWAAAIVGLLMLVIGLQLLVEGQRLSSVSKFCLVSFLVSPFVLTGLLRVQRNRKRTFLFEVLYCALFLAAISITAHT